MMRKILAERQGFEPWEGCPSTVFKTAAIDHSAISPRAILSQRIYFCKYFFILFSIRQHIFDNIIFLFISLPKKHKNIRKLNSHRYNVFCFWALMACSNCGEYILNRCSLYETNSNVVPVCPYCVFNCL